MIDSNIISFLRIHYLLAIYSTLTVNFNSCHWIQLNCMNKSIFSLFSFIIDVLRLVTRSRNVCSFINHWHSGRRRFIKLRFLNIYYIKYYPHDYQYSWNTNNSLDWENRRFRRVRCHVYQNRNLHTILNCYVVILNI